MVTFNLGRRGRLAAKIAGFVVLALVSFVFALQLTFPYDRVKDKLVDALAATYDVTVGEVSRGVFPGTFSLERVTLRSRPTGAGEVPDSTYIERIDIDVGVLALLRGVGAADIEIEMGGGTLEGSVRVSRDLVEVQAAGVGLPAGAIPQIRDALGLPLIGKLSLGLRLSLPRGDWGQARGALTVDCAHNCTLGDGEAKFKPKVKSQRSATMMGEGIEFGHVYIDRFSSRIQLEKGKLEVTKFEFDSKDAELKVDLEVRLGKKLKESEFLVACFRFRASPALQEREPKTAAAIATTGGVLGPDDLFHIKLEGRYVDVKARGRVCSGDLGGDGDGDGDSRPAIGRLTRPMLAPVPADAAPALRPAEAPQPGADIEPTPVFDAAPAAAPPDAASREGASAAPQPINRAVFGGGTAPIADREGHDSTAEPPTPIAPKPE